MNLNEFSAKAVAYFEAGECFYLKAAPGRGKTTTIEAAVPRIAAELGLNLGIVTISGPNLSPGDTVGFGIPRHNADGTAEMVFTLPFFWRTLEGKRLDEYDGGVVFVDEADKMDTDIKKVMGEMALSGRCGPHRLPPGWVVWMAGNRSIDRSGSTKEFDHLINRRFEIDVEDDLLGWETWALQNDVHPSIIAFAMQNPHIVFPAELPEKQGPFCTPRSLVAAGKVLYYLGGKTGKLATDTNAVEVAAGAIGQAAAAQLFATIRLEGELPTMEQIVGGPDTCRLPGKPDAQMLVCYKLAHMVTNETLEPVIQYVERLPADFAVTFAKALVKRSSMFAAQPPFVQWVKRNSSIVILGAMMK